MENKRHYKIPRQLSGERADKILRQALKESGFGALAGSRSQLANLFTEKQVFLASESLTAGRRLRSGDVLSYTIPQEVAVIKNQPDVLPLKVYENELFFVFDKPPFMAMHGGEGVRSSEYTFSDYLKEHYPELEGIGESDERPGMVHRLDKETSGLVLIARTNEAYEGLKGLFLDRAIQKTYIAICYGYFREKSGSIELPIRRQRHSLKRAVVRSQSEEALLFAKAAKTDYEELVSFDEASLLILKPKTGRMHQIRVHLQALHHPILGDRLYGTRDALRDYPDIKRQMLHALRLDFTFLGVEYAFEALPPEDFREALESLDGFQRSGYDYEALKSLFSTNGE